MMEPSFSLLFLLALFLTWVSQYLRRAARVALKGNTEESNIRQKIAQLKVEAEAFNSPSTFAKYSKLMREVMKEEQKLKKAAEDAAVQNTPPPASNQDQLIWFVLRSYGPYLLAPLLYTTSLPLPSEYFTTLYPISLLLGSVTQNTFQVSGAIWYLACCGVVRQVLGLW